jgi:hypothetical protein
MYLTLQNRTGLATIPGVTPEIIGAGADALLDTYTSGFRNVWVSAVGFVGLAAIGKSNLTRGGLYKSVSSLTLHIPSFLLSL